MALPFFVNGHDLVNTPRSMKAMSVAFSSSPSPHGGGNA
jgi:hypothetical protein